MTEKHQTYRTVDKLMMNNEKHLVNYVLSYLKFCKVCHKQNELCKCEKCVECETKAKYHPYATTWEEPLCENCCEDRENEWKMCHSCKGWFNWAIEFYCWDWDEAFCDEDCFEAYCEEH